MNRTVVARAPTRVDLGGGWTDVPPYPERDGGAVCSVAITRYATATVVEQPNTGANTTGDSDRLIRAAVHRAGRTNVSAALSCDFPIAAGLGGSSAAGVALAGALAVLVGDAPDRAELAATSRETEVTALGVAGGFQDHYAAAFGGASLFTFGAGVVVERLDLSPVTRVEFARRAVLVYTGESRISSAAILAVRDAYMTGEARVIRALARMKGLALDMAAALRTADLDLLGALIGEHWTHQRALHSSITTARIEAIVSAAAGAGALGSKAMGASAGGCVLCLAARGREDELVQAISPLGNRLAYAIDDAGFDVLSIENDDNVRTEMWP